MQSFPVVERFDVSECLGLHLGSRRTALGIHPFVLETVIAMTIDGFGIPRFTLYVIPWNPIRMRFSEQIACPNVQRRLDSVHYLPPATD